MPSLTFVLARSKNFTSREPIHTAPFIPVNTGKLELSTIAESGETDYGTIFSGPILQDAYRNQQRLDSRSIPWYSMLEHSSRITCFEHAVLFTVSRTTVLVQMLAAKAYPSSMKSSSTVRVTHCRTNSKRISTNTCSKAAKHCIWTRINPYRTTSFLTATALVYAIGAGITAAVGTRLALQSILSDGFGYHPFLSSWYNVAQGKYFSSLPRSC